MSDNDRDRKSAIFRGLRLTCPACGEAPIMKGYLDVRDQCENCHTELHHHRADDGPAWITILITGHLMAPLMLLVFEVWRPEGWVMALGFSVVFVALSLFMLPRMKGAFVGIQWANRMHGFAGTPDAADV